MASRQKIFGVISTFLLSMAASGEAWAATYYVATNGSDSSPGNETYPFKTIAYAVGKMVAGDTTYVRGGVYSKPPAFHRSGTESAPIKLLNAPGESPVIDCGGVGTEQLVISNKNGVGHITIEGFEIRNCYHGMHLHNGYNLTISRNWIHDNKAQGILGNGKNILVDRNVISHNGSFAACAAGKLFTNGGNTTHGTICNKHHGIYTTGPNWVITNNLIYDNLAYGISVSAYKHCPQGGCYGNKVYADASYGGADNWLIANNVIAYQHYRGAIVLWMGGTTNSKIINNIFYENSQKYPSQNGIEFSASPGGGHIISNNICYATAPGGTTCIEPGEESKYTASGNIVNTVNPGFVSAGPTLSGVPNFKLRAGSPAIDKGQSLPQVTWDHAGGKRPFGAAFDIGAYEFGSLPDSGSPPPNPTGGGGSFTPGAPVFLSPTGEICPSPYL
ncbi:MAG: hypothetical protein CV089_08780 [Nitrospira sp. WS110]|nr:hypothetical protein [Nitrospira sp. WS110]